MRVDIIVSVAASRNATFRRMRSRNGAGELVLTLASPSWHQRHDSRHKCPCPLGREICESLQTAIPQGQFPGARRLLPTLIPSMTAPSPRWLHQHLAVRPQLHRRFPPAQVPASEPANQRTSARAAGLRRPLSPNQAERHRAPKSDGMILCVPPPLSAHFPPPHAPSRSRISAVGRPDKALLQSASFFFSTRGQ